MTTISATITIYQSPPGKNARSMATVAETEALLEEWFGAPVVLTSSGRGATLLALTQFGLNRYEHLVVVPRMITACVMIPVVRRAFPIESAGKMKADATLFYHQYGFPQTVRPSGLVLEDICHSFFKNPATGARAWVGDVAVFSLPKFMTTAAMVGGLVVPDRGRVVELRRLRDSAPARTPAEIAFDTAAYMNFYFNSRGGEVDLEKMYVSRLINPRIDDEELGGLPRSVEELKEIGRRRRVIGDLLLDAVGHSALPQGWPEIFCTALPYLFPVIGEEANLERSKCALNEIGVTADIYWIDLNRDMTSPRFERMLLVPCHDAIPDDIFREQLSILRSHRGI